MLLVITAGQKLWLKVKVTLTCGEHLANLLAVYITIYNVHSFLCFSGSSKKFVKV